MSDLKEAKKSNQGAISKIDVEEIIKLEQEKLTEDEFKTRAGDAELFYRKHFERVLKLLFYEQLKEMARMAETPTQITYFRGMMKFYEIIDEWFKKQNNISKQRFEKEEKPEPGEVVPPVGSLE